MPSDPNRQPALQLPTPASVAKTLRRAVAGAPPTQRGPRRTQEERRAETRAKLLDATIRSLEEHGYAATTTRRVAELAGVSQGAMTHHFPYRVDLVGAAVEELAERRIGEARERFSQLSGPPVVRAREMLDLLWADFSSPLFTVLVKLWVAAADDPELYARLVPIERRTARAILEAAVEFGGEPLLELPDWEVRITVALSTVRGLALSRAFEPRERPGRDPWPQVRDMLEATLLPPELRA